MQKELHASFTLITGLYRSTVDQFSIGDAETSSQHIVLAGGTRFVLAEKITASCTSCMVDASVKQCRLAAPAAVIW